MNVGYLLIILGLAELGLSIFIISRGIKSKGLLWYGFFTLGVSIYVLAYGAGYLNIVLSPTLSERLAWSGGLITAVFILPFSFTYPIQTRYSRELLPLIIWPLAIFLPGFLFTNAFVIENKYIDFTSGSAIEPGTYIIFFLLFFVVYWVWAILNLIKSSRSVDGSKKKQLIIFIAGTIISLFVATYFDLYKPFNDPARLGYIGSLCTTIWFGVTGYILLKKENV